jgi:tetratricopeptide (TPR) repeat protein
VHASVPATVAAFLLALCTLSASVGSAQSTAPRPFPTDSLERANELYGDKRYRSAGEIYGQLLSGVQTDRYETAPGAVSSGALRGTLHFNRANAYLHEGELGRAILHYEKAARHLGPRPALTNNLEIARDRIENPVPELPRPFWERWALAAAESLGPRGLFYIGLIGYLAFLTCVLLWAAGTRRTSLVRAVGALSLLAAGLGVGGSFAYSHHRAHVERAVVLEDASPLYGAPQDASGPTRRVSEGVRIRIRAEAETVDTSWVPVRLSDGETGWMRADALGRI